VIRRSRRITSYSYYLPEENTAGSSNGTCLNETGVPFGTAVSIDTSWRADRRGREAAEAEFGRNSIGMGAHRSHGQKVSRGHPPGVSRTTA
jgi:hypothetical protein